MKVLQFKRSAIAGDGLVELFAQIRVDLRYGCVLEIAEAAGLRHTTLYRWREGLVTMPQTRSLVNVARVLGYTIEWRRG